MQPKILNEQMLHGGDYNPDQWLDRQDILEKDIDLMKQAEVNCVSLGIFAWSALEPTEGVYTFDWLEETIERIYTNGIYTILATPSGARPQWMAQKYPEVLRIAQDLTRNRMGARHNHCFTSPVYREKVWEMNKRLSERFGNHPSVLLWHLSNEYSGTCYCPLCQAAFRQWVQKKYQTLEALNHGWWTRFWSHTYTDWSQIEAPIPKGEMSVHGLYLDWQRFTTDQTIDFCKHEIAAVRAGGSDRPVTTNLMGFYDGLNYFKFKDVLDIVSWDSYPLWHSTESMTDMAVLTALTHDLMRSIQRKPFLLMESTPSQVNWQPFNRLKRPQMHMLSSMQAIAHGANSVQYFQWRKSRGSYEKFHGAVVDHYGKSDTRVFREVAAVGMRLHQLGTVCHTVPKAKVAIIYDWENRWAIEQTRGARNGQMHYIETIQSHYQAFWSMGVSVDIIDMECTLEDYHLVIAPMLYMYRAGMETKLRNFVQQGGILVGTYWSGMVDENDLCFLEGTPHGMMAVFGLRAEEIDPLTDTQSNGTAWQGHHYRLTELCERVIPDQAQVLAVYETDFYAGEPVLTVNDYGAGKAYYLTARAEDQFYRDFYGFLNEQGVFQKALTHPLPEGVTVSVREGEGGQVLFLQNYNDTPVEVVLGKTMMDFETHQIVMKCVLDRYEMRILRPIES